MSFGSMPGTSALTITASLVSETSRLGAHSPVAGNSSSFESAKWSKSFSISCLTLGNPIHGINALIDSLP